MPHQSYPAQIQLLQQRGNVVRQRIVVVALIWLVGSSVASPVQGNTALPAPGQVGHLILPPCRIHPPWSEEYHWLALAASPEEEVCTVRGLDESLNTRPILRAGER